MKVENLGYDGWYDSVDLTKSMLTKKPLESGLFILLYLAFSYFSLNVVGASEFLSEFARYTLAFLGMMLSSGIFFVRVLYFQVETKSIPASTGQGEVFSLLFIYLVIYVLLSLGLVLLVLPAILLWVITLLAPMLSITNSASITNSFKESYTAVRGNVWRLAVWEFLPIILIVMISYLVLFALLSWLGLEVFIILLNTAAALISITMTAAHAVVLYQSYQSH